MDKFCCLSSGYDFIWWEAILVAGCWDTAYCQQRPWIMLSTHSIHLAGVLFVLAGVIFVLVGVIFATLAYNGLLAVNIYLSVSLRYLDITKAISWKMSVIAKKLHTKWPLSKVVQVSINQVVWYLFDQLLAIMYHFGTNHCQGFTNPIICHSCEVH